MKSCFCRHPRESGDPGFKPFSKKKFKNWIPAFAGMTTTRKIIFILFLSLIFHNNKLCAQQDKRHYGYNTVAVDFPFDGGAMLSYTRSWRLTRFLDAGWVISGGRIDREFELKAADGTKFNAETEAWVLPLTGPVVSLHNEWIGISLGYAAFWANTDLSIKNGTYGTLTGKKKGWGMGFYSPLLVLDFYDQRHDLVFGFGLGGFFGTSYPQMEATAPGIKVSTDESPIDTLTFHIRTLWGDGRKERLQKTKKESDDF